jgi:hypothetical protein
VTATDYLAYTWTGIGFLLLILSVIIPLLAWEEWQVNLAERAGLLADMPTESEKILSDSSIFLSFRLFIMSVVFVPMDLVITSAGLIAIMIPPTTESGEDRAIFISSLLISTEMLMGAIQILLFVILLGIRNYRRRWYMYIARQRERRNGS